MSNLEYTQILTLRSGLAISGSILQKGLITSKNLTETKINKQINYIFVGIEIFNVCQKLKYSYCNR